MDIRYPAKIEKQADGKYFVQFVDFDDIFTEGDSEEEAQFNAVEALSGMLAWKLDNEVSIPPPSKNIKRAVYIAPDSKTQEPCCCD